MCQVLTPILIYLVAVFERKVLKKFALTEKVYTFTPEMEKTGA